MGNSQTKASQNQLNTINNAAGEDQSTANALYGTVAPLATQLATNPQGFSPKDINNMTTASNETLGGGQAAATGAAGLAANRTGNTGATSAVIDQAQRQSDQQQSANNLGIQNANAQLKQQQQEEGLSALDQLYGTNKTGENSLYGNSAGILNAGKQPGWFQSMFGDLTQAGNTSANILGAI